MLLLTDKIAHVEGLIVDPISVADVGIPAQMSSDYVVRCGCRLENGDENEKEK